MNKDNEIIKNSRISAKAVSSILKKLEIEAKPGRNGKWLEKLALSLMKENKVKSSSLGYHGFPSAICVSVNEQLTHGIPSYIPFVNGDLVSIDVCCNYKGCHADAAVTFIVCDEDDKMKKSKEYEKKQKLIDVTKTSLDLAIKSIVPWKTTTKDIGKLIQSYVEKNGFFVIKEYGGHGIGRFLHMDPFIPNFDIEFDGKVLKPGMLICIEPLVQIGDDKVKIDSDGKTVISSNGFLNAHFEHTIFICDKYAEIISKF